jgi:hypothetical protein
MDREPFIVLVLIDSYSFTNTLVNTGCLSNRLCDPRFARKNGLICLKIITRQVTGVDGKLMDETDEVVAVEIDLDGYRQEKVFLYIALISDYNMILGMPWIRA